MLGAPPQPVVVADLEVRPVDRLQARRARRHEQRLLRVQPALRRCGPGARPSEAARSA